MKFGLLGESISHSKSPQLFKAAYNSERDTYELLDFSSLEKGLEFALLNDFKGINITTPFKEHVEKYVDVYDTHSERIFAVNLLMFEGEKIHAFNTDYFGVTGSLQEYAKRGMSALVLGYGGAGKAAAVALQDMGLDVTVSNREASKAEPHTISKGMGYCNLKDVMECAKESDVIVDTLPVRHSRLSGLDFRDKIVLEARYKNPSLNSAVKREGGIYISGITWLINQAKYSFLIFTGKKPNIEAMEKMAADW